MTIGFTGNPLQRWSEKRSDADWLQAQITHKDARYLCVWKGAPLVGTRDGSGHLQWLNREALKALKKADEPVLLGLLEDIPHFAVDVSLLAEAPENAPFADLGVYTPLRTAGFQLSREDLAIAGQAMWLLNWNRKNQFSPLDGSKTMSEFAGIKRVDRRQSEFYPRINPVVIVLISHEERCLIARSPHFPDGFYSALAGYVEAGESLEECAAREVFEEVGSTIHSLSYVASQPWPLSQSMMIGYLAKTDDPALCLDAEEIEDAKWVDKEDIKKILSGDTSGQIFLPPEFTIAGTLLRHWIR